MPGCALPLRQPARDVVARELQPQLAMGSRADLERRVPQPTGSTEPAHEHALLSAVGIGANPVTFNHGGHANTDYYQTGRFQGGRSARSRRFRGLALDAARRAGGVVAFHDFSYLELLRGDSDRRSSQAITPRKVRLLAATSVDALRNRAQHHRGRLPLLSDPVLLRERDEAHEERLAVGSIPGTAR